MYYFSTHGWSLLFSSLEVAFEDDGPPAAFAAAARALLSKKLAMVVC